MLNFSIFLLLIFAIAYLIQRSAKFLLKKYYSDVSKKEFQNNPYVDYHKWKLKNDKDYDAYLEWLGNSGEGVPVDKIETPEDKKANSKIDNLMRKV